MQKRWNIAAHNDEKTRELFQSLRINKNLCSILVNRKIDSFEKAKNYFRPLLEHLHDPWLMKDMDKATQRILHAINSNERILVYGDYDVDGTASVASMFQFLIAVHPNIDFYIPHRNREGYGVSKAGIDYAAETNCNLIISVDCGIKSADLILYAKTSGIDFIICDHHLPDPELPDAVAILNPKQPACNYPYKDLCGCGVAFKLMTALAEKLHLPAESYLKYLDLVATAIAADMVPMTGENRVLAFYGLKKVNEDPCAGIKALMELAAVQKEMFVSNLIFIIAPRINAAGRMDDAKKAVQLFIEQDCNKAIAFAEMLHNDNTDRREADTSITGEALALIAADEQLVNRKTTVLYQEHWHKGVVGIVASRLIETYYRPTIVLTRSGDVVAGSARSVSGFNIYEAIHACRDHLIGYGGHLGAAGMTLLPENVEAFSQRFEEVVNAQITSELLIPELVIDAQISFKELNMPFYNIINQMEPFGPENLRPVFIAKNVKESGNSRLIKDQHIKFHLKQDNCSYSGIGFNLSSKFHLLQLNHPLDIAFSLDINEWNGEKNLQLKVCDIRLSE